MMNEAHPLESFVDDEARRREVRRCLVRRQRVPKRLREFEHQDAITPFLLPGGLVRGEHRAEV